MSLVEAIVIVMTTSPEGQHEVTVEGQWHNDNTAGVFVWCNTCNWILLEGDDFGDRLTPDQIIRAVLAHQRAIS